MIRAENSPGVRIRARLLGLTLVHGERNSAGGASAQPQLQRGMGAFWVSLVVGTIWSVWHYWPSSDSSRGHLSEFVSTGFLAWWAYEIANSVIMMSLYNGTGGSLPIAWAGHDGLSLGQNLVNSHPIPFGWFVITFWTAAALMTLASRTWPNR